MNLRRVFEAAFSILLLFCLMLFYPYLVVELLDQADQDSEPFGKIP